MTPADAESVISCAEGQAVQPWQAEPDRLWSLLEMLQYTARAFFWCGRSLRSIRGDCITASAVCRNSEPGIDLRQTVDTAAIEKAKDGLTTVENVCRQTGMPITADMAHDAIEELGDEFVAKRSFEWLLTTIENLERVAEKELKNKVFLYLPPERAKYWPTTDSPSPFGAEVAAKFPSAGFDAVCAAQCLALGMATAAVLHLMRALEVPLAALGDVFEVSLEKTNWHKAIEQIEKEIKGMGNDPAWTSQPDWRDKQEFYAQAATHFGIIKDAWRNHAAHAREKYGDDEAERIYQSVKAFFVKLSQKLAE